MIIIYLFVKNYFENNYGIFYENLRENSKRIVS